MTANPVLSYVHGVASMIEINEAATVSRTIMKACLSCCKMTFGMKFH